MTMSAADFAEEWFETDVLKATLSASGIIGTFLGPRSPGTAYVLLHHYMGEIDGHFRAWGFAKGGTGAVAEAIASAAREAGAEIRTDAPVAKVLVKGGRVSGVALANGDEVHGRAVSSSLDPRRTFLDLVDEDQLPDDLVRGVRAFRFRGSSAKVNLALDAAPDFTCMPGFGPHLRGAVSISPSIDYLGTRLRRRQVRGLLAAAVHRHRHPLGDRPGHGAARQARHVVLRAVRALRAARGDLGREARGLRRHRDRHAGRSTSPT